MNYIGKSNRPKSVPGIGEIAVLSCVLLFSVNLNAQTNLLSFQSAREQTALLELYTSEGCSSCPPADGWLSGLTSSPRLWQEFVPLAFHVDYWDYIGWRDPFGSKAFSDRQRAYAASWQTDNIYTPGFVLNGKEWRGWSGQSGSPKSTGVKAGVLMATTADTNHWRVSFSPAVAAGKNYEAHAALLGNGLSSDVKAGENRGRQLKHDFVVRSLIKASLTRNGEVATGEFDLLLPAKSGDGTWAIAVWVTEAGHLEPLQATGGWISPHAAKH